MAETWTKKELNKKPKVIRTIKHKKQGSTTRRRRRSNYINDRDEM